MRPILLPLLARAGCSANAGSLTDVELQVYEDAHGMPRDVQNFIVRWQDCNHWQGEPQVAPERDRQIARAIARSCPGIDAEARRIRARHAGNDAVMAHIRDYQELER